MSASTHYRPPRIIRLKEVLQRTGLSRSTVYERVAVGGFPKQVRLGGHSVGWVESEVDDWIFKQINSQRRGN